MKVEQGLTHICTIQISVDSPGIQCWSSIWLVWLMILYNHKVKEYEHFTAGALFTERTHVLSQDLLKSRSRFEFILFQSLCNLTGKSAAALPRCQSNYRAIRASTYPILQLRDFTRSCGKTHVRLVNKGLVYIGSTFFAGLGSPFSGFMEFLRNYRRQIIEILCLWLANDCVIRVIMMVSMCKSLYNSPHVSIPLTSKSSTETSANPRNSAGL